MHMLRAYLNKFLHCMYYAQMQRQHRHFKSGRATANKCAQGGGGGRGLQQAMWEANQLGWKELYTTFFFPNGCFRNGKDGLVGSLNKRPTCRPRLRSRTTATSGMCHIASSSTSYTHVYLATPGCQCSLGTRPTTRWKVVQPRPDCRRLWDVCCIAEIILQRPI